MEVSAVTNLGWVTGERSPNRTGSRFGVYGTDLGICWDGGFGQTLIAFGDSYGEGWGGDGGGPPEADWRCNVLALSGSDRTLDGGLAIDDMIRRNDGHAAQLIGTERLTREVTVIPTSGIAVDGRNYLHYMSVERWGPPGHWRTGHAGIAYSDDGGRSWHRPRRARWRNSAAGDHPFQLGAFAGELDGHVYLLGTPNGRFGDIRLACTPATELLRPASYRYWDGSAYRDDPDAAAPVMAGPAGELSVQYNTVMGRWLAMHLDEHAAAIVLRTAAELTGPWDERRVVVSGRDYPALYGGFLHPYGADKNAMYFLVSQWGPYNVMLMRAELG